MAGPDSTVLWQEKGHCEPRIQEGFKSQEN